MDVCIRYTSEQYAKEKEHEKRLEKLLDLFLQNIELDENYSEQGSGSTKAYKLTIPNCISVEEDENYTDECYPNSDFEFVEELIEKYRKH